MKNQSSSFLLRMPKKLRDELVRRADRAHRSINAELQLRLKHSLETLPEASQAAMGKPDYASMPAPKVIGVGELPLDEYIISEKEFAAALQGITLEHRAAVYTIVRGLAEKPARKPAAKKKRGSA